MGRILNFTKETRQQYQDLFKSKFKNAETECLTHLTPDHLRVWPAIYKGEKGIWVGQPFYRTESMHKAAEILSKSPVPTAIATYEEGYYIHDIDFFIPTGTTIEDYKTFLTDLRETEITERKQMLVDLINKRIEWLKELEDTESLVTIYGALIEYVNSRKDISAPEWNVLHAFGIRELVDDY